MRLVWRAFDVGACVSGDRREALESLAWRAARRAPSAGPRNLMLSRNHVVATEELVARDGESCKPEGEQLQSCAGCGEAPITCEGAGSCVASCQACPGSTDCGETVSTSTATDDTAAAAGSPAAQTRAASRGCAVVARATPIATEMRSTAAKHIQKTTTITVATAGSSVAKTTSAATLAAATPSETRTTAAHAARPAIRASSATVASAIRTDTRARWEGSNASRRWTCPKAARSGITEVESCLPRVFLG